MPTPATDPRPPRGSRLIAFVFALNAALLVSYASVLFFDADNIITIRQHSEEGYDAYIRNHMIVSRSSAGSSLRTEIVLWYVVPAAMFVFCSAVVGWYAGRWFEYRYLKPKVR